ncbi:MAG TPA: sensor domain-containing diguanylate cyclase [Spirochaetia bacterium]|nr:sensor domain-containing diguanylate cyclase [Spirochaetia bacterium]
MSNGLVDELHEVPLDRENQDLREIIEVAFQITAQLDIENIIKNVVWSFVSRFQNETVTVLLSGEVEDSVPLIIFYRGVKREELSLELASLSPILAFLDKNEYGQVSYSYFRDNFPDKAVVERFAQMGTNMIVPLRTDKGSIGILLLPKSGSGEPYGIADQLFMTRVVRFASIAIENANLFRQAITDRMTGLYSHHFFEKTLEEELERARRYKSTFSLLMFDIDHFKKFNDVYGHLQGDRIIREIARVLMRSIRQVDFPARYGGEEFAVILPSVDLTGALVVAERIRRKIESFAFPNANGGAPLHVTISVGATELDPESAYVPTEIIRDADKALYKSKAEGRNRVSASSSPRTE